MLYRLVILCLMSVSVVSCSRSGGTEDPNNGGGGDPHVFNPTDITAPQIAVSSPTPAQQFSSGSVITVSGRVTDDFGLYRGTIKIINDANGVEMKSQAYEIHGLRSYDFSLNYTASVGSVSNYTVVVFFEDHGLNGQTKAVNVQVNP